MSTLNVTYYAKTKKEIANIKREFRNSLNEEINAIGINDSRDDLDTKSYLHLRTQSTFDWENDEVSVSSHLLSEDRFTLSIYSENEEFNTKTDLTIFMDNDVRLQLIEALSNVVIHKVEE